MTRTCADCGTPVSHKSTGRCRPCARIVVAAKPSFRKAMSQAQQERRARELADPVLFARMVEQARAMRAKGPLTPEIIAKQRAARDKLFWCPEPYRSYNTKLRNKGFSSEERKRIVAELMRADEHRRLVTMSPFERQLEKVRNGAALIERVPMPSRQHDFSITGSSMA